MAPRPPLYASCCPSALAIAAAAAGVCMACMVQKKAQKSVRFYRRMHKYASRPAFNHMTVMELRSASQESGSKTVTMAAAFSIQLIPCLVVRKL